MPCVPLPVSLLAAVFAPPTTAPHLLRSPGPVLYCTTLYCTGLPPSPQASTPLRTPWLGRCTCWRSTQRQRRRCALSWTRSACWPQQRWAWGDERPACRGSCRASTQHHTTAAFVSSPSRCRLPGSPAGMRQAAVAHHRDQASLCRPPPAACCLASPARSPRLPARAAPPPAAAPRAAGGGV